MTTPKNTLLVIFGITGDLSSRKLLPALSELVKANSLPENFRIVGTSRQSTDKKVLLGEFYDTLSPITEIEQVDISNQEDCNKLADTLDRLSEGWENVQKLFYLSIPPQTMQLVIRSLGTSRLNDANTRLLVEKPFGTDYSSAQELISETKQFFKEEQIYRIDHYMAKEMAQNILTFRRSNTLFKTTWSNKFIQGIQIIASEAIGIEGRVRFYEQTGAMRDLVQSHLMQLLALTIMELPEKWDEQTLIESRIAALRSLELDLQNLDSVAVRAQYDTYADEVSNPSTLVETFVNLKIKSNLPQWEGVPLVLTTGKALAERRTEIRITYCTGHGEEANLLTIRIVPDEGIDLELRAKKPGYDNEIETHNLDFSYAQHYGRVPEAYEQVIINAVRGDRLLFAREEEVLASWKLLQPVLQHWSMSSGPVKSYKKGASYEEVRELLK